MPKMKSVKSASKRFKRTASGKLKRRKAFASHILKKKSTKRKRGNRQSAILTAADQKRISQLIHRGGRSKLYKTAKESVDHAMQHSYIGRKQRKRQFRSLWIARINAATRMRGASYSVFMNAMNKSGVQLNRKILAELAVNDGQTFDAVYKKVMVSA